MAYIEKRKRAGGKVVYRARVRQSGAPDLSASFPNKAEAVKWGQKMESEVRAGRYFGREESKERTFQEFIDRYIERELPKNKNGYEKQKMLLTWWKSHLGAYYLCYITPSMIAELRDRLMQETTVRGRLRTTSTTNRYLSALSRAYTICQKDWQWIKDNPVLKITRPKENKPRDRYLEKEEISLLLDSCKKSKSPHLYPVVSFALATGARKGEILGLKYGDIDWNRSTATFKDTKNGTDRTVFLNSELLKILRNETQKRVVMSEYVFPSVDGKRPADIRTAWDDVIAALGFKNVCFHSLRHTAASHLCMSGATTFEIGKILGHKTLYAQKIYSHMSTASTASILDKMNRDVLQGCVNA